MDKFQGIVFFKGLHFFYVKMINKKGNNSQRRLLIYFRLAAKNDNNIDETEVNKADRSNIKVQVVLRYTKTKTTKRVFVAGSMTQWKTLEMGNFFQSTINKKKSVKFIDMLLFFV